MESADFFLSLISGPILWVCRIEFMVKYIQIELRRAGVKFVNDRRLVLQLRILCGAGYCTHAISFLFTHKQYHAAGCRVSALRLFFQCVTWRKIIENVHW